MLNELIKEKMLIRKSNPIRSVALGNLIDKVKKAVKEDSRDPLTANDHDIVTAARRLIKENQSTIDIILHDDTDSNDFIAEKYKEEIDVYQEFLPVMIPPAALEAAIDLQILLLKDEERNMKSMGKIVGIIKGKFGDLVDMSVASKFIKEKLNA